MRTKLVSAMIRMFPIAVIVALIVLASACGVDLGGPACRTKPPDTKEYCTCGLDGGDCEHPKCKMNTICGASPRETDNPRCQMAGNPQVPANQQIAAISGTVTTEQGFGFPRACEPFKVNWTYINVGNQKAAVPPTGPFGPRLEIVDTPFGNLVGELGEPKNIPWSALEPCAGEGKSVMFPGISKPGTYRADFVNIPVPAMTSGIQFVVGLGGDSLCK